MDISEGELNELIRHTGAKTKREAVLIAVADLNRRKQLRELSSLFGTFDGLISAQELRRLREES